MGREGFFILRPKTKFLVKKFGQEVLNYCSKLS
jgi:hypothetical protein